MSMMRRLATRRGLGIVVMGVLGLLLLVVLSGLGPNLPGPKLREIIGVAEPPPVLKACVPKPSGVRGPPSPKPAGGRWRRLPDAPYERDEVRAAAVGDTVFLANGHGPKTESIGRVETFDVRTRRYGRAPSTPVPLDHAGMVTYGGEIYVVGGYENGESSNRLFRYSPRSRRWSELPGMRVARGGMVAEVVGNRLYVAGGAEETDKEPTSIVESYSFASEEWRAEPDMPTPSQHVAGASLDGKLYAIGGRNPGDLSLDLFERFDPASGRWERLPALPFGSGGLAATATGDRVIAIAGGDDDEGWVTPAVWAFDPGAGRWSRLPDLRVPRHGHAATAARGQLLVFGGAPCARYGRTGAAESLRFP